MRNPVRPTGYSSVRPEVRAIGDGPHARADLGLGSWSGEPSWMSRHLGHRAGREDRSVKAAAEQPRRATP